MKEKIGDTCKKGRARGGLSLKRQFRAGVQDIMYPLKHGVAAFGVQNMITLCLWANEIVEDEKARGSTAYDD